MPKTKDSYRLTGNTVEELRRELDFIFARIADRLDKIEGIRDSASIESDLTLEQKDLKARAARFFDSDETLIHSME